LEARSRHLSSVADSKDIPNIDLWIDLDRDRLFPWEAHFLGIAIHRDSGESDSQYIAEFSLATAIGMQPHALKEAVSSVMQGSDFKLYELKGTNERAPVLESDGWHNWACRVTDFPSNAKFEDLFFLRDRISQAVFLMQDVISTPYLALSMIELGQAQALLGCKRPSGLRLSPRLMN
jgi:hypothetical protein